MQRYQSHKQVHAGLITSVRVPADPDEAVEITIKDLDYQPRITTDVYGRLCEMARGANYPGTCPIIGGYLVRYDDGYTSWSPAQAFEEGYSELGVGGLHSPRAACARLRCARDCVCGGEG